MEHACPIAQFQKKKLAWLKYSKSPEMIIVWSDDLQRGFRRRISSCKYRPERLAVDQEINNKTRQWVGRLEKHGDRIGSHWKWKRPDEINRTADLPWPERMTPHTKELEWKFISLIFRAKFGAWRPAAYAEDSEISSCCWSRRGKWCQLVWWQVVDLSLDTR